MSNASLKEQLQALSIATDAPRQEKKPVKHVKKPMTEGAAGKQKPLWLEAAHYGIELLRAHYPGCFKENKEVVPLKVGIKQDLVKHLSSRDDIVMSDKACMVSSLTYYVNSSFYLKSVVIGATRIDLEGNPVGMVTEDEARYSKERRQVKQLKKESETKS